MQTVFFLFYIFGRWASKDVENRQKVGAGVISHTHFAVALFFLNYFVVFLGILSLT